MPRRNDVLPRFAIGPIAFLLFLPLMCAQAGPQAQPSGKDEKKTDDPQKAFASQCGVDFEGAPLHIFINSTSRGWKEHRDAKDLPELSAGEDSEFIVRSGPSGQHYVRTFSPGDDFDRYQDDCFGETGKLQVFHYELRTAWGWGYEETRAFGASGKMVDKSSRFFDTRNEKTVPVPERAKEVPDALRPEVHSSFDDMPFALYWNE